MLKPILTATFLTSLMMVSGLMVRAPDSQDSS